MTNAPGLDSGKPKPDIDVKGWADELGYDIEPRPEDEDFHRACALMFGNMIADTARWQEFYKFHREYFNLSPTPSYSDEGAAAILKYIAWFQRELYLAKNK